MFTCRQAERRRHHGDRLVAIVAAWSLVVLIALPFTPPFSACSASMLLAPQAAVGMLSSPAAGTRVATAPSIGSPQGGSSVLTEEQLKDGVAGSIHRPAALTGQHTIMLSARAVDTAESRAVLTALRL